MKYVYICLAGDGIVEFSKVLAEAAKQGYEICPETFKAIDFITIEGRDLRYSVLSRRAFQGDLGPLNASKQGE